MISQPKYAIKEYKEAQTTNLFKPLLKEWIWKN